MMMTTTFMMINSLFCFLYTSSWFLNDECDDDDDDGFCWVSQLCNYIKRAVEGTALYYRLID